MDTFTANKDSYIVISSVKGELPNFTEELLNKMISIEIIDDTQKKQLKKKRYKKNKKLYKISDIKQKMQIIQKEIFKLDDDIYNLNYKYFSSIDDDEIKHLKSLRDKLNIQLANYTFEIDDLENEIKKMK